VGCATLPMQDPARALAELNRAAALPGVRGVYLGTNVKGRELSDPDFAPIFARCEALRLPAPEAVLPVEPVRQSVRHRGRRRAPRPRRRPRPHPKLEVCLPHAGGAMPYLVGRLQHGQRVRSENANVAKRPFGAYLRRSTYDTISHSPEALRYLIALVGADRVMLGSDYCFDMGPARPRDIVERQLKLSRADRARILSGTARRLLRL
jgi:aminocarboxymuconate-semialdehyde decarboxylase